MTDNWWPTKPNVTSAHYKRAETLNTKSYLCDKGLVKSYICSYNWWLFMFNVTWSERHGGDNFSLLSPWFWVHLITLIKQSRTLFFIPQSCSSSEHNRVLRGTNPSHHKENLIMSITDSITSGNAGGRWKRRTFVGFTSWLPRVGRFRKQKLCWWG